MTRKDFETIAKGLYNAHPGAISPAFTPREHHARWLMWTDTVDCVADELEATYPRFDRERFVYYANYGYYATP